MLVTSVPYHIVPIPLVSFIADVLNADGEIYSLASLMISTAPYAAS